LPHPVDLESEGKVGPMVCLHTYSESDNALLRYGYLKFFKMAAGRHLGFDPTGNGAVLEYFEYFCQMSSKSILIILSYTVLNLVLFLRHSVLLTVSWPITVKF